MHVFASRMIGYYIHHHGAGHAHRASAVTHELRLPVTGLSSLSSPPHWPGEWLTLARDDDDISPLDVDAGGSLHWVPESSPGLRSRMAAISRWIEQTTPELLIVDISVEVALLARLHGVPVVTVVLPGVRTDSPHLLAHRISRRVIAAWPPECAGMLSGIDEGDTRLTHVGGFSRFDDRAVERPVRRTSGRKRVALLAGRGGHEFDAATIKAVRATTPEWEWTILGLGAHTWVDDPWTVLVNSNVVVTHAGQNALAEVAAARRPAVLLPQQRPHGEQGVTTAALRHDGRLPVVVLDSFPSTSWSDRLDGERWRSELTLASERMLDGRILLMEVRARPSDVELAGPVGHRVLPPGG